MNRSTKALSLIDMRHRSKIQFGCYNSHCQKIDREELTPIVGLNGDKSKNS